MNFNYFHNILIYSLDTMCQFITLCSDQNTPPLNNVKLINPENIYRYIESNAYPYYREATIPQNSLVKKVDQIYFVDAPILGEVKKIKDLPNWYNLEFCTNAIEYDEMLLCLTKVQNDEICLKAIERNIDNLEYVIDQTEKICQRAVELYGYALKYIKNQTSELCKKAVMTNGGSLFYISEKTPELCYLAVQNDGYALRYITNQTEEMCLMAIENNPQSFAYVTNKTEKIYRKAIEKDPYNILRIKDPDPSLVLLSLSKEGLLLIHQEDKTEEMCKIALQNNGMVLRCISQQTEEMVKLAIANNGFAIKYVKDQDLFKKYQDQAFNQIKSRFSIYLEFVPFYLSIIDKPEIEQLNALFGKYTKEQLLKIIKQRYAFYNYIFDDTVDDKEFDQMKKYYEMYNVNYRNKTDFELCINVGEFHDEHFKMIDYLVLLDVSLIFDFVLGKYDVLDQIKPLYGQNLCDIFDNLQIEKNKDIIYHNYENDIISDNYIIKNEYVNGILCTEKKRLYNNYTKILLL